MATMQVNRIGVVGFGSIGRRHLANIRAILPEAKICVARLSGCRDSVDTDRVETVFSLDALLRFNPDATIIAAPAAFHMDVAERLLECGSHVFIEKPVSHRMNATNRVAELAIASELVVAVGYNLRHLEIMREVRRLIVDRSLGTVFSARASVGQFLPDWRSQQDYRKSVSACQDLGGGAILELSHELDYLQWIFGAPRSVIAIGGNSGILGIDVEDHVDVLWESQSGMPRISVHLDMLDRAGCRELYLSGNAGVLRCDFITKRARIFDVQQREWNELAFPTDEDPNNMYVRELEDFFRCIKTGESPVCSLPDGLLSLSIAEAIKRSIESDGKCVKVDAV